MEALETRPLPLSRAQRLLLSITALAVGLTRLLALSRTPWDWDEAQFALAMQEYDPPQHRPHPPGFPLFMALATMVRPLASSDFHALQAVVLVGAIALFPLLFLLCRELRFPFATAYGGSLLAVFLPNVWFYGGTAFSDVPSLALTVAACALLLRGVRDRGSLMAGATLLGLAAAIRPQALLLGCAPALVVMWKRRGQWRDLAAAAMVGGAVIAVSYAGAALASSSVGAYLETGAKLRDYLRQVDSFLSPTRPPLAVVFHSFFLRAIPGGVCATIVLGAAVAGVVVAAVRREGRIWLLMAMFLPFQVFAWLMLDHHSATRYGVAYAPMYAILAAAAVAGAVAWVPGMGRGGGAVVVILFTAALARWTLPALTEVRRNPSPPVAAMRWISEHVPPTSATYVHSSVAPFARYYLAGRETTMVNAPAEMTPLPPPPDAIVVMEHPSPALSARRFVRRRGRLFDVVRQRYFEVTVVPAQAWAEFGEGWYGEEWHGEAVWHWMGRESRMRLPPLAGPARLTLRLGPVLEKGPPAIEVRLNGVVVERFTAGGAVERTWSVPARAGDWNELVLTSDRSVNPAREGFGADGRDLALQLLGYDWAPAGP
ncbi:MAG TPA: hypothetical protein VNA04_16730 [Thermoanaerobaculia bacterium]|nr:hypothetical protein [Thermoanaerobaculia bacterium]